MEQPIVSPHSRQPAPLGLLEQQEAVADLISNEVRRRAKSPLAMLSRGDPAASTEVHQMGEDGEIEVEAGSAREAVMPNFGVQVTGSTVKATAQSAQRVIGEQPNSSAQRPREAGRRRSTMLQRIVESSEAYATDIDSDEDLAWAKFGGAHAAVEEDVGMQRLLETEAQPLLIMQFSDNGMSIMRTDLTRTHLVQLCRHDIDPQPPAQLPQTSYLTHSTSSEQLAELERDMDATAALPPAPNTLSNLHLRDLRYLQGVNDHHIMPRRGALVLSLGLMNVVITHRNAYFVVHDGADRFLQPLLSRLHNGHKHGEMAFELRVLEAVLLTLITHHSEGVERCLADKTNIADSIRLSMGSEVLTKIWKLKRIVSQLVEDIEGCERAIQDVQEDEEALALICMSAMHENPRDYMLLLQNGVGNTEHVELLLDAYALEFHALSSQLTLVQKEIEATEDVLTLQLDVARNNLWKLDILVGMASMWISLAFLVSGFFGMNLYTAWSVQTAGPFTPPSNDTPVSGENPSWPFFIVTVGTGAGSLALIFITTFVLWAKGYLVS